MTSEKNGHSFTHWSTLKVQVEMNKCYEIPSAVVSLILTPFKSMAKPHKCQCSCALLYWEMLKSRMYIWTHHQTLEHNILLFPMGTFTFPVDPVLHPAVVWNRSSPSSQRNENSVSDTSVHTRGILQMTEEMAACCGDAAGVCGRWVPASTFWAVRAPGWFSSVWFGRSHLHSCSQPCSLLHFEPFVV